MKNLMLCALAILAFAVAVPASAQYVIEIPQVYVSGGGYYNPYYGRGYHRSGVGRVLHTLFGPETYYPYGTRPYGYDEETSGKCFERVAKAAKKQRVDITAGQIAAYCNGQPLPARAERSDNEERVIEQGPAPKQQADRSEPISQAPLQLQTPAQQPVQTTPRKPRGMYLENGVICNDDYRPLTVLLNGAPVGVVAPGGKLTLSRLPAGVVDVVQAGQVKRLAR